MIRWTQEASVDFEAIRGYIEANNPSAAIRQSDLIAEAIEQIDSFPRSGRKVASVRLRQLTVPKTPYIVFYRLHPEVVIVSRILHGAMRRPKNLFR
jgi:toxin ParE1/3/4